MTLLEYLFLIESKTFKDTIDTDSSSTTVEVNYEGFMAQINSVKLEHRYYNKETTITKAPSPLGFGIAVGGRGRLWSVCRLQKGKDWSWFVGRWILLDLE